MKPEKPPIWSIIPVFKSVSDDGDNWIVRGLGADSIADFDPKVDRDERLSAACIEDMKAQLRSGKVRLIPSHWDRAGNVIITPEWYDDLGEVFDAEITPSAQMFPKIKLDPTNSKAEDVWKKVNKKKALGLSWGGKPIAWHTEIGRNGKMVRVFDKIELWHFAVTTKPVNSRTLTFPLQAAAKSVNWEADPVETSDEVVNEYYEPVCAILKSYHDGETAADTDKGVDAAAQNGEPDKIEPETVGKTLNMEAQGMELTKEQLDALLAKASQSGADQALKAINDQKEEQDKIAAAVKTATEPLLQQIEALKAKDGKMAEIEKKEADIEKKEKEAEEAAKAAAKSAVDEAVKAAIDTFKTELPEIVKASVEKVLDESGVMKGLQGGAAAAGAGHDGGEMTAAKAFQLMKDKALNQHGEPYCLTDFSDSIQQQIISIGEATMKSMGGFDEQRGR